MKKKTGSVLATKSRLRRPRQLHVTPVEVVPGAMLVSKLLTDIEVCQVEQKLALARGNNRRSRIVTDEDAAKLEDLMIRSSIARAVNEDTGSHSKSRLYRY